MFDKRRLLISFLISVICSGMTYSEVSAAENHHLSDDQIKQLLIQESVEAYPKTCACPYSTTRNGSRCGGRSAWSKPGGYSPLCYKDDVTKEMIAEWRENN